MNEYELAHHCKKHWINLLNAGNGSDVRCPYCKLEAAEQKLKGIAGMTDHYITEIIPELDEAPEWVQQAFRDGKFFSVVLAKIAEHEKILHTQERYWRQKIEAKGNVTLAHMEPSAKLTLALTNTVCYTVRSQRHEGTEMTSRTDYDWDHETTDEHGDVDEHSCSETLRASGFDYAQLCQPGNDLVLVKDWHDDGYGINERTWAYAERAIEVAGLVLPKNFQNGDRVPKRFHAELKRWQDEQST